ncbi:MAG: sulfatase [Verrucomicrobiae bacterium]|nr:sulfatase [Verrucomicrobiae bacterium]
MPPILRRLVTFAIMMMTATAASPLTAAEPPPNVLFIAIDDMNDWVGCLDGHPQVKTPHIDALAERGVNFTNAHCQAPICNCSRVSLTLSQRPSTTGMYFLAPNFRTVEPTKHAETLFQYFRGHGYYLTTRGKIFHGKPDPASFDHIEPDSGWRRGKEKIRYVLPGTHPLWDWGQVDVPDEDQRDYQTAAWAVEQLKTLPDGEKPFFLAIGFHLPHVPIYASKKWFDLYPLDQVKLPPVLDNDQDDIPEIARQLTLNSTAPRHQWMVESGEWPHAVQAYLAANSFVDSLVGMMIEALDETKVADNTIIVLWSDHGFHLGEKQKWAKRSIWEETTRIPLIFAGPGVPRGKTCSRPAELLDIYPTLADLCGLPAKEGIEGVSLRPLLENSGAEWDRPAITTFGPNNHSIRSEHFRYTVYDDGSEELYDHRTDPNEWHNLAGDPKMANIIAEHRQWLPKVNVAPLPGSAGSDSPLYGEGGKVSLQEAMERGRNQQEKPRKAEKKKQP